LPHSHLDQPDLHSFPTRRSSDLTVEARLATLGHLSAASRATGPLISVPFNSPSGVIMTAALSSKESRVPSGLRSARACLTTTAGDRRSTRLNSSHLVISYAVFCL